MNSKEYDEIVERIKKCPSCGQEYRGLETPHTREALERWIKKKAFISSSFFCLNEICEEYRIQYRYKNMYAKTEVFMYLFPKAIEIEYGPLDDDPPLDAIPSQWYDYLLAPFYLLKSIGTGKLFINLYNQWVYGTINVYNEKKYWRNQRKIALLQARKKYLKGKTVWEIQKSDKTLAIYGLVPYSYVYFLAICFRFKPHQKKSLLSLTNHNILDTNFKYPMEKINHEITKAIEENKYRWNKPSKYWFF
jgi:hypothetical protein